MIFGGYFGLERRRERAEDRLADEQDYLAHLRRFQARFGKRAARVRGQERVVARKKAKLAKLEDMERTCCGTWPGRAHEPWCDVGSLERAEFLGHAANQRDELLSAIKQHRNATESRCRMLSSREAGDTMLKPDRDLYAAADRVEAQHREGGG